MDGRVTGLLDNDRTYDEWMRKRPLNLVLLVVGCITVLIVVVVRHRSSSIQYQTDSDPIAYQSFSEQIMATTVTVLLPMRDNPAVPAQHVFETFHHVDERMSEWKPTSTLTRVNQSAGSDEPVKVPDYLRELIEVGVQIGDLTDGEFDITWAALWGLWDFKADNPSVPDSDEISQRVQLVDYQRVQIDAEAGTVRLPVEGMLIGLGGIAKGYALDQSVSTLRENMGLTDFLISAGGQVIVSGQRSGRPWRVGIRDPRGASADDYFGYVELDPDDESVFTNTQWNRFSTCSVSDETGPVLSVSTSGDYERYYILDGVRYHHILDPQTGWPADGRGQPLRSATVVCRNATLGDALSTALIILGTDRSLELVKSLNGVEALLVDAEANVHMTSGMDEIFTMQRKPYP